MPAFWTDEYAGLTGDSDTSIIEYGGLGGYSYAYLTGQTGEGDDPTFHDTEEQTQDGEGVIDGGVTQDEDTNAGGEAVDIVTTVTPWWVYALVALVLLVLLSDYAGLAAKAA